MIIQELDYMEADLWVSPEGRCYDGHAHAVCAKQIVKDILGIQPKTSLGCAENILIKLGWIKLTTSAMFPYYYKEGMYNNLTPEQEQIFFDWKRFHNIY